MKVVVVGGTGRLGSHGGRRAGRPGMTSSRRHRAGASTPSPAPACTRAWWASRRRRRRELAIVRDRGGAHVLPDLDGQPARRGTRAGTGTMSGCRSWVPTARPTAVTCGPRSRRRRWSRTVASRTRSSGRPSSSSSSARSPTRRRPTARSDCRRRASADRGDDLAVAVADVVEAPPANAIIEVAGPEALGLDELARRVLSAAGDPREVVTDDTATYYGPTSKVDPHARAGRPHRSDTPRDVARGARSPSG